jgi:hypothetical protein
MKKMFFLGTVLFTFLLVNGASIQLTQAEDGCFYKNRACWWKPDTKCSGSGNDCPHADPCGNDQLELE